MNPWLNAYGDSVEIVSVRHPGYQSRVADWKKWRLVYEGGPEFVEAYLKQFSNRESVEAFRTRKELTPTPTFAKAAVNDIKNAIFQRLADVVRIGGHKTYQDAVQGYDFGIDLHGSSMNAFIGMEVLPELLPMAKFGVWVDKPPTGDTLEDSDGRPFVYGYKVEDILAWEYQTQDPREFKSILLRDYVVIRDGMGNMPIGSQVRYRFAYIGDDGFVRVRFFDSYFDADSKKTRSRPINADGLPEEVEYALDIKVIPFHVFELQDSLLADVCNHQIALLNLESSDISYALKANFPFYVEQNDGRDVSSHLTPVNDGDGTEGEAVPGQKKVEVGGVDGRIYGPGMNAPAFINPSPEPLQVSMKKQQALKDDIRQLVNLALANAKPRDASAESKQMDERGLEAGLSYIGLVLEHGERKIAHYWSMYYNTEPATVKYPQRYSLGSEEDRRKDVEQMGKLRIVIPSKTFQKKITLKMADRLLGCTISSDDYEIIRKEIEDAESLTADPDVILQGVEAGIIDLTSAAILLGWPKDGPVKAAKEHAERLARIAEAQSQHDPNAGNAAARGVGDMATDPQGGKTEKAASRDNTQSGDISSNVRGKGKNNGE